MPMNAGMVTQVRQFSKIVTHAVAVPVGPNPVRLDTPSAAGTGGGGGGEAIEVNVWNNDATNTIWIVDAATRTAADGYPIKAGQSMSFAKHDVAAGLFAIATVGACDTRVLEKFA